MKIAQTNTQDSTVPQSRPMTDRQREALAQIERRQIQQIYKGRTQYSTPHTTPVSRSEHVVSVQRSNLGGVGSQRVVMPVATSNEVLGVRPASQERIQQISKQSPQPRSVENLTQNAGRTQEFSAQGEAWKKYHTAWQNYYQKYYESYYSHAFAEQQKKTAANVQPEVEEELTDEQKRARALAQLKKDIAEKARQRTKRVRKSRHIIPLITAFAVVSAFLFLQFNRIIFANVQAYVVPNNPGERETIQMPNAQVEVSQDPKLIIPKINVEAPVIYGVGNDNDSQLEAMNNGVAHFAIPGANSVPGQIGNTVLSGHSSNDLFDGGHYKFIFTQLEKLVEGDVIYANYNGVRYTYAVREIKVVLPTEVNSVVRNDGKAWLTLLTCTPIGTAQKRLLVFAEQISPNPANATRANDSSAEEVSSEPAEMPRNSKTFFERLFSWDWS